jgi:hypothetical protein
VQTAWTRPWFDTAINRRGSRAVGAALSDLCLATIVLSSDSGRVAIITLGESEAGGSYRYVGDNVAVFFSVDEARKAQIPLPG